MELTGKAVTHKCFGEGIVTEVEEGAVAVSFSHGEKRFVFPDGFSQFITFTDKKLQKQVEALIAKRRLSEREKQREAQRQEEQLTKMSSFKVRAESQAAFAGRENPAGEVFKTWSAFTGRYLSGRTKGEAKVPLRLMPNSACLITSCEGVEEQKRRLEGIFMVQENFFGELCRDGVIKSHETYRLKLMEEEQVLFWDYLPKGDGALKWGNGEMKYISNKAVEKMLFDIKNKIEDEDRRGLADEMYRYFYRMNNLPAL